MSDGYVRIPASRKKALEDTERQLHELRLQLQQQEMARANAEYLQDQLVPSQETPLEVITNASRTGEFKRNRSFNMPGPGGELRDVSAETLNSGDEPQETFAPPQTLDDLLPDAERDSADDILAAIENMPNGQAQLTLRKVAPLSIEQEIEQKREKHRTAAERNTTNEVARPMRYGEIFATVLEMLSRNGDVVMHTKLLTPENVQIVMEAIETGMSRKSACAMIGVTYATFSRYKNMASEEEPQEPFASFMQLIEMAEARAEAVLVGRWQRHTTESWQAAKSLLEKRFKQDWSDKQQVDLQLEQLMRMSPEQLLDIMGPSAKDVIETIEQAEGS